MELEKRNRIIKRLEFDEIPLNEYIFQGPKDKDKFNFLYTTLSQMQYYDDNFVEIRPIAYTNKFAVVLYSYLEHHINMIISQLGGELIEHRATYSLIINCDAYKYVRDGYKRMFIDTQIPDKDAKVTRELSDFIKNTHDIYFEKWIKNSDE